MSFGSGASNDRLDDEVKTPTEEASFVFFFDHVARLGVVNQNDCDVRRRDGLVLAGVCRWPLPLNKRARWCR